MTQKNRIVIAAALLVVLIGGMLGVEALRRSAAQPDLPGAEMELPPGSIPVELNGALVAYFTPDDLEGLDVVSFVDDEEGKTQEGWLLRDVLLLLLETDSLGEACTVTVASSSREKSVELTWEEVADEGNKVLFDLSGRGTLKLASLLEQLNVRDEWIQDVDSIVVTCP